MLVGTTLFAEQYSLWHPEDGPATPPPREGAKTMLRAMHALVKRLMVEQGDLLMFRKRLASNLEGKKQKDLLESLVVLEAGVSKAKASVGATCTLQHHVTVIACQVVISY